MKIDLAGNRVVVAGGSRGIGRPIALAFAEAGAAVSICARGAETLRRAVARYIAQAAEALGEIGILVSPQLYNAILRGIPFGRLGRPEEVAQVALFLVSPLAGWATGQTIMVDGGQTLGR